MCPLITQEPASYLEGTAKRLEYNPSFSTETDSERKWMVPHLPPVPSLLHPAPLPWEEAAKLDTHTTLVKKRNKSATRGNPFPSLPIQFPISTLSMPRTFCRHKEETKLFMGMCLFCLPAMPNKVSRPTLDKTHA